MLDILLGRSMEHLITDILLKQTLSVGYFTELVLVYIWYWAFIWGTFGNSPVNKADTLC